MSTPIRNYSLSAECEQLLAELSLLSRTKLMLRRFAKQAEILRKIVDLGEPLAAFSLLGLALHAAPSMRHAAARAIRDLLLDLAPLAIMTLQDSARESMRWRYLGVVASLDQPSHIDRIDRIDTTSDTAVWVWGVASCHPHGFLRERSTRALAQLLDGAALPFLLIRANDWVSQVREAAVRGLHMRVEKQLTAGLVACLPLLDRLRLGQRAAHGEIIAALESLLESGTCDEELSAGIRSTDRLTRRACMRAALSSDRNPLHAVGLASSDEVVRLMVSRALLARADAAEVCALANQLANDAYAPLRYLALKTLVHHAPPYLRSRLEGGCFDRSAQVRELARFYLKRDGGVDLVAFYRQELPALAGQALLAGLEGLGECGTPAEIAIIQPYLNHESTRVRIAALRALASLDYDAHRTLICECIESPLSSISKAAARLCRGRSIWGMQSSLEGLSRHAEQLHVRHNASRVLRKSRRR